jgi:uncharacterized protein (DUF2336 family)
LSVETAMTPSAKRLIDQFHDALGKVSSAEQLAVQRQVADLLLASDQPYSERQVAIFNDVIGCLVEKVDRPALLELTGRLAAAEHAPNPVINHLSNNDDIAVAGQVLERSKVLTDENLVEIAKTKGQEHLLAIAARAHVSETVTDALVERGDAHVTQKVVSNNGARLSELGFVRVVHEARTDEALASTLAHRKDVPPELRPFLKLAGAAAKPAQAPAPAAGAQRSQQGKARPQDTPKPQDKPNAQARPGLPEKPKPKHKAKQEKWMPISRSSSGGWDR